ncbi:MAG TPA: hypothetical protein DCZ56_02450 [Sutterella sp.]|nr:hypothetical protein [Sutterella sp.]
MTVSTTRRNFLKTAAVSSAALGGMGLMAGAQAAPLALPKKWDMTADLVVGGSGIAGMSAAVTAIDLGAKVVVLEKNKNYGGAARINGGIIALRDDSPEDLYKLLTNPKSNEYRKNDPALVRKYSKMRFPTRKWLEDHGVKFLNTSTKAGQYDSQHHEAYLHIYSEGMDPEIGAIHPQRTGGYRTGRGIMMPFKDYFEGKGGKILLEHKLTDVYRNAKGRVIGARVQTPKGVINIRARKGVVLAGGSWKANKEFARKADY